LKGGIFETTSAAFPQYAD